MSGLVPIVDCKTAEEVRALARRYYRPARAPVVVLRPKGHTGEIFVFPDPVKACERAIKRMWVTPPPIKIADIQRVVARAYHRHVDDLRSATRTHNVVHPRQIAMYLAKTMTSNSFQEIGRRFGGRDHTTILHACRKIEAMQSNAEFASHIRWLVTTISREARK